MRDVFVIRATDDYILEGHCRYQYYVMDGINGHEYAYDNNNFILLYQYRTEKFRSSKTYISARYTIVDRPDILNEFYLSQL